MGSGVGVQFLVSTSHVTLVSIQYSLLYILVSSLLLGNGVEGEGVQLHSLMVIVRLWV